MVWVGLGHDGTGNAHQAAADPWLCSGTVYTCKCLGRCCGISCVKLPSTKQRRYVAVSNNHNKCNNGDIYSHNFYKTWTKTDLGGA